VIDGYRRRPLYSADNEDTRSELTALEITGDDTVVAIAAGGGRALSLLTAGPKRLVAIDRRADQLFNLELKAAAMDVFEVETFQEFLGISDGPDRLDQYAIIRPMLSRSARRYWDNRHRLLDAGPFFAGRTETALLRFMRGLKKLGVMQWAEPFFQAECVEEQRAILDARRHTVDRGLLWWRLFCHPLVVYSMAQDPSFLRSTGSSVGAYLADRLVQYASINRVRDSYLLRLAYDCGLTPISPLPPYLTPEGFELARKSLGRLEILGGDLRDFAARHRAAGPVKWSLSDVSCWMTEAEFQDLLRSVIGIEYPGSRYCFRNFAARRDLPRDLASRVMRLRELGEHLSQIDSSVIYRIEVGLYPRSAQHFTSAAGTPREEGCAGPAASLPSGRPRPDRSDRQEGPSRVSAASVDKRPSREPSPLLIRSRNAPATLASRSGLSNQATGNGAASRPRTPGPHSFERLSPTMY
jgi:S-adenosylmethionine-diacylglycerol 3-amino-3-carboxypropyl transferase